MSPPCFGFLPDGRPARLYVLSTPSGFSAGILDYGAIVVFLRLADATATPWNLVLGYDTLDGYVNGSAYMGAIVGRVAGLCLECQGDSDGTSHPELCNILLEPSVPSTSHTIYSFTSLRDPNS
jgi:aldose 1-epimerase